MKVISTGLPQKPPGRAVPAGRWKKLAIAAVPVVLLGLMGISYPVFANSGYTTPDAPDIISDDVVPDVLESVSEINPEPVSYNGWADMRAESSQRPVKAVPIAQDPDNNMGEQLSVSEEPVDPDPDPVYVITNDVALAAAAREAAVSNTGGHGLNDNTGVRNAEQDVVTVDTAPKKQGTASNPVNIIVEPDFSDNIVTDTGMHSEEYQSEPETEPETGFEQENNNTDPPDWLVGSDSNTQDGPPDWLFPEPGLPDNEQTIDNAPDQSPDDIFSDPVLTDLEKARLRFPYDNGVLSGHSWAQVPVPFENFNTRGYADLDTPLSWLTQGDFLNFAATVVQNCDADWFTIIGPDSRGIEFRAGNISFAIYGPVDEYGEVTEILYYIYLGEYGYYIVSP